MEWGVILAAAAAAAVATLIAFVVWRHRRARAGAGSRAARRADLESVPEAPSASERLRRGLAATRQRLAAQLDGVLGRGPRPLGAVLGDLEEVLISADVGVGTTRALLEPLRSLAGGQAS